MDLRRRKSDEALLALWRDGRVKNHQMTVSERYRLWELVIAAALKEAKAHRKAEPAALARKTPAA